MAWSGRRAATGASREVGTETKSSAASTPTGAIDERQVELVVFLDDDGSTDGSTGLSPSPAVRCSLLQHRTPAFAARFRFLQFATARSARLSDRGIAQQLFVTQKTVEAHVRSILRKLGLRMTPTDNRRVHAVLTYLRGRVERVTPPAVQHGGAA